MSWVLRFLRNVRTALWRAFRHDCLTLSKAGAYSSILTLFPALLVVASLLASFSRTRGAVVAISGAIGSILPRGVAQIVQTYFASARQRPFGIMFLGSLLTLWFASGVLVSWMEGFRKAYDMPKTWGLLKERLVAFGLVIMAGIPLAFATALVAFGERIETRTVIALGKHMQPWVLIGWAVARWTIAILTGVSVMQLIYHNAVPRTLRWHTVLPGAALATGIWFPVTLGFAWYVSRYAEYSIFYGSLATAVVLLVWMFILSLVVLMGAEFNALLYPRPVTRSEVGELDLEKLERVAD